MPTDATGTTWLQRFPALAGMEPGCRAELLAAAHPVRLAGGSTVFVAGQQAVNYLLVLDGRMRVYRVAANGREVDLYRVGRGQSCVLTTSCLFAGERYPADGVTETVVHAIAIPRVAFHAAVSCSTPFRQFVFTAFAQRITGLLGLIDELVFGRIDARLAQCLLRLTDAGDGAVARTHQELAAELGSAREVISRQLKEFEHRGLVQLARGRLTILDREALAGIVAAAGM